MSTLSTLANILPVHGEKFWSFLTIKDVLNVSTCSRQSAGLILQPESLERLIAKNDKLNHIGLFKIFFDTPFSAGVFRRVLNRFMTGREAILAIDVTTGRVIIDIGSAFNEKNNEKQVNRAPVTEYEEPELDSGAFEIRRDLELTSCDEFDDFKPRHPLPKLHRRDDSYFNSDADFLANDPTLGAVAAEVHAEADLGGNSKESVKQRLLAAKASKMKTLRLNQNAAKKTLEKDDD